MSIGIYMAADRGYFRKRGKKISHFILNIRHSIDSKEGCCVFYSQYFDVGQVIFYLDYFFKDLDSRYGITDIVKSITFKKLTLTLDKVKLIVYNVFNKVKVIQGGSLCLEINLKLMISIADRQTLIHCSGIFMFITIN